MEDYWSPKNMTKPIQVDDLNKKLYSYGSLSPENQQQVRRNVIDEVTSQRKEFGNKLKAAKADLKRLNLILGATGAGKSTLFNYLNGVPLKIIEGVNTDGSKNQEIKLEVDKSKLPPNIPIAPIGHGFISETTIPNFAKSQYSNVTYVDCAGEFDTRDILQSIINSYFKYELAMQSEEVRLSIAINYKDLTTNRGTIFKQILEQVGNFIGLWQIFMKSQSISLVITGVDLKIIKEPKKTIISTIKEIARDVKDLGLFKEILQDIAGRGAIAIFASPSRIYKDIKNEDGQSDQQAFIPEGQPFKPNSKICSPELISKTLDQTNFMKSKEGLFLHNLQNKAQFLVNAITEGLIEEIKAEVMNSIMIAAIDKKQQQNKKLTIQQFNSQKQSLNKKIQSLAGVKKIQNILTIFQIKKSFLGKYESLCLDLKQFLKISNIPNIENKIIDVVKNIIIFLREKIGKIDKNALQFMKKAHQQKQKEIQKIKELNNQNNMKYKHQIQMETLRAKYKLQQTKEENKRKRQQYQYENNRKRQQYQYENNRKIKQDQQKKTKEQKQKQNQNKKQKQNQKKKCQQTLKSQKQTMVKELLYYLQNHEDKPNRNWLGMTFEDHKKAILNLNHRGSYVYKVIQYKGNMIKNILGMITGYKFYLVDVNGNRLNPIISGDQQGKIYVTDSKGSGNPPAMSIEQDYNQ